MPKVLTRISSVTMQKNTLPTALRFMHSTGDVAFQLSASHAGGIIDNRGATGAVMVTLPGARKGAEFHFIVVEAQELRIHPHSNTGRIECDIAGTWTNNPAGEYVDANAGGEFLHLVCKGSDTWMAIAFGGTWSAEN